jgi:hypothetical protein
MAGEREKAANGQQQLYDPKSQRKPTLSLKEPPACSRQAYDDSPSAQNSPRCKAQGCPKSWCDAGSQRISTLAIPNAKKIPSARKPSFKSSLFAAGQT